MKKFLLFIIFISSSFFVYADNATERYFKWIREPGVYEQEIKNSMASKNWREKNFAILAAGRSGDKKYVKEIINILKSSKNKSTLNCAVTALGDLKALEAVDILEKKILQSKTSRFKKEVIKSLGKIGDKKSIEVIIPLLFSGDKSLYPSIVDALKNINNSIASDLIVKYSKKRKFPVVPASEIFSYFKSEQGGMLLIEAFPEADTEEKVHIYDAIGNIKMKAAMSFLIHQFKSRLKTSDRFLMGKIRDAMVKIDSEEAILPLCDIIADENSSEDAVSDAVYILSRLGSSRVDDEAFKFLKKGGVANPDFALILGFRRYERAFPDILKMLRQQKKSGRDKIAEALGLMGDKSAVPELIKILESQDISVQQRAVQALGRLEANEAEEKLILLLDEEEVRLVPYLLQALGKIGGEKSAEHLVSFYYKTSMKYQLMAGVALSEIECRPVDEFIKKCLFSNIPRLEKMGKYIFKRYDNKRSIKILEELVSDGEMTSHFDKEKILSLANEKVPGRFKNIEDFKKWVLSEKK